MRDLKPCFFLFVAVLLSCNPGHRSGEESQPNIVLIFVDDLGYGDPGCYGGKDIGTPNIDQLASEGVLFTDAHVTCAVCGPSRLGLLTGMYQQKLGCYWNDDLWQSNDWHLPDSVLLLPEILKEAGYVTGHIGKWNIETDATPYVDEAFDVMLWKGAYYPDEEGKYQGVNGGDFKLEPHGWGPPREGAEYLTDRLTRHAVDFIERHREKPFFLYLAYNAPHTPLQADIKYDEKYSHLEPEPYRIYAGMVSSLDENIGKILLKLKETGLEENTLVIFTSDNGPAMGASYIRGWKDEWPATLLGSAGQLNGHKGNRYEGGHREPFIIRWPSVLEPGRVYMGIASTLDIYPTLAAAAGARIPENLELDGVDLMPYLQDPEIGNPHDTLFWMTHNQAAVRLGDWKLLIYDKGKRELYNLREDPREKTDLSLDHPDRVYELLDAWEEWSDPFPVSVSKGSKFSL